MVEENGNGDKQLGKWIRIGVYVFGAAIAIGSPIVCMMDKVSSAESKADNALMRCEQGEKSLVRIENKIDWLIQNHVEKK